MLRIRLTLNHHKCAAKNPISFKDLLLRLATYTLYLVIFPANAVSVCKFEQECTWKQRGTYVELSCKPKPTPTCTWAPDPVPPPAPPPPPPPPLKTADQIAKEEHIKFCKNYPSEIEMAVMRCKNSAKGYTSYFIETKCNEGGGEYNFAMMLNGASIGFRRISLTAADCRAGAEAELRYIESSCDLSGKEYSHILQQQCSDVP